MFIYFQKGDAMSLVSENTGDKGLEKLLVRSKRSNGRWTAQQVIFKYFFK
jgi:hypothetical protein